MKKYLFIYKTTNLINGKIYIGRHETNNLEDGYIGFGIYSQLNATLDVLFHRAVRKYGYENFKCEVLEDNILTFEELKKREIFWIAELHSQDRKVGYNINPSGDGGWNHWNGTEKHREMCRVGGKKSIEIQKLNKGMNSFQEYNKNLTIEQRQKKRELTSITINSKSSIIKRSRRFQEIGHQQGEKNSQFGTHIYINLQTFEKKRYKEGGQPEGWITTTELKKNTK